MKRGKHQTRVWAWLLVVSLLLGMVSGYQEGSAKGASVADAVEVPPVVVPTAAPDEPVPVSPVVLTPSPQAPGTPDANPQTATPQAPEESETATPEATATAEAASETGVPEETAVPEELVSPDPASLRLIFTSDVHGQLTTEDYEGGRTNFTSGGYCRTATLIEEARAEVDKESSFLFDLGDNLYDYTTDYIYNYDSTAKQPIYAALAKMDYDAVTLGNHEFEYTFEYIKDQLRLSGMAEKVVLSNVWDAVTKKHVWAENRIFSRKVMTESGKELEVKVGVIGETVPGLSVKRTNYTGILETEDIVANVKKETAILKQQGADVIVVLAHSGIGKDNPEERAQDTGYALTKVEGVDAVLCGHRHRDFPLRNKTTVYDNLPNVDPERGLINGKPVAQVQNRGASLGIVDLKIAEDGEKIRVIDGESEIRKVNRKTKVNQEINECAGDWPKLFISDCSEILCDVSSDAELQNYFGTIEDTDAIQLLNDIKIAFGIYFTRMVATDYKDYPVVAASRYFRYGSDVLDEYIDITDHFKRSNIYSLVQYKTNQSLYQMTGAQIREWLEWSASCYEAPGHNLLYPVNRPLATMLPQAEGLSESGKGTKQTTIMDIIKYTYSKPLQYALQEEYLGDWSKFYIFDGLDYTIDATVEPRYDADGNQVSDAHRILSLTKDGEEVKEDDVFVVVADFGLNTGIFTKLKPETIYQRKVDVYRDFVEAYLRKLSQTGGIRKIADHNWRIRFSDASNYLLKSDQDAEKYLEKKSWLKEAVGTEDNREYYLADFGKMGMEDDSGPSIHAVPLEEEMTDKDVPVYVQANDGSGVYAIKYAYGRFSEESEVWNTVESKLVSNHSTFACDNNGLYSIYAVDQKGNARVSYINILNINRSVLAAPVVDTYTNRKNKITGTAEPNATIYFSLDSGKTYSAKVGADGTFSYKLPAQKAGKMVYVYVADASGKASAQTVVTVKRTGPNKPALQKFTTASKKVSGVIGDTYAYPVVLVGDKTLYVPNENVKALYTKSDFYKKEYAVKVYTMTIKENGEFSMTLPEYLASGTPIKLATVDVAYRCSLQVSGTCALEVPNKPLSVSSVTNLSKTIKVYTDQKSCKMAVVKIGNETYSRESASYDSGKKQYYYIVSYPRTDSTKVLHVYLNNAKGNSKSISVKPVEKVPNLPKVYVVKAGKKTIKGKVDLVEYEDTASGAVKKKVTKTVKERKVPAIVTKTETKVFVYVNGKKYKAWINAAGKFSAKLKKPLQRGDRIVCKARNAEGYSLTNQVVVN